MAEALRRSNARGTDHRKLWYPAVPCVWLSLEGGCPLRVGFDLEQIYEKQKCDFFVQASVMLGVAERFREILKWNQAQEEIALKANQNGWSLRSIVTVLRVGMGQVATDPSLRRECLVVKLRLPLSTLGRDSTGVSLGCTVGPRMRQQTYRNLVCCERTNIGPTSSCACQVRLSFFTRW